VISRGEDRAPFIKPVKNPVRPETEPPTYLRVCQHESPLDGAGDQKAKAEEALIDKGLRSKYHSRRVHEE
jgi:hypothetical protein